MLVSHPVAKLARIGFNPTTAVNCKTRMNVVPASQGHEMEKYFCKFMRYKDSAKMKVVIDADDAALELKAVVVEHLKTKGVEVVDLNLLGKNPNAAYPEVGFNLAQKIKNREFDRGILICGTGLGMAMIANKVETVYAGVCHDTYSAERLRKSNDAQVLTMGARVVGPELAKSIVDAWLASEFQGGGSASKVETMRKLEKKSFHPEP
jgi:ribose 5-phosphate isomerase B